MKLQDYQSNAVDFGCFCFLDRYMKYNKQHPLRVFEAFAGYSSQSLALRRLREIYPEFDFVRVGFAEFDPFSNLPIDKQPAVVANRALFGNDCPNYGDICKVPWMEVPDFELFTYSFPCTDISAAGRQAGLSRNSGTRSSLLWECEKAIEVKRPKFLLMENVSQLISQKFIGDFQEWLRILERLGYESFTQVLDASKYGVPQHRERVFSVGILRTEDDPNPVYHFPRPFKLEKCLADVLEEKVDDNLFLSDEMLSRFAIRSLEEESGIIQEESDDFEDFFVQG